MAYAPERGDVVWLSMDPRTGHEQAGHRPALILSPMAYNRKVGLAIVCPITSRRKGYPFEVEIPQGLAASGVILSDRARNLDWRAREAEFICRLPDATTGAVLQRLGTLVGE